MNILYKISDNYFLGRPLSFIEGEQPNEIVIFYSSSPIQNINTNFVICTINNSLEYLLSYINDNKDCDLEKIYYIQTIISINENYYSFIYIHDFVDYCINSLNFRKDSFSQNLAHYIFKVLKNMVFI